MTRGLGREDTFAVAARAALAIAVLAAAGPARAQDNGYCAAIRQVLGAAPDGFATLRVGQPEQGFIYRASVSLPGAARCTAVRLPNGRAYYECSYPATAQTVNSTHSRLVAQTSACFGHRYAQSPSLPADTAIIRIDSINGRYSVNTDFRRANQWADIWVERTANAPRNEYRVSVSVRVPEN
jgi:hypothetical protein